MQQTLQENQLARSLSILAEILFEATDSRAVVLVDEYDTPMLQAAQHGYKGPVRRMFNYVLPAFLNQTRLFQAMHFFKKTYQLLLKVGLSSATYHSVISYEDPLL